VVLSVISLVWSTGLLTSGTTSTPRDVSLNHVLVQAVDSTHHHKSKTADSTKVDTIYTCPMDPQVVKREAGNCPLCGMKLVKKIVPHDTTAKADTTKKQSGAATTEPYHQTR
jgi:hypothetical protein